MLAEFWHLMLVRALRQVHQLTTERQELVVLGLPEDVPAQAIGAWVQGVKQLLAVDLNIYVIAVLVSYILPS